MRQTLLLLLFFLFNSHHSYSQIYILGNISDSVSKEAIAFKEVEVRTALKKYKLKTDFDGNFKQEVKKNSKYKIAISNSIDTIVHIVDSSVNLVFKINSSTIDLDFNWLDKYNAQAAKNDIEEGNIYLLTTSFHILSSKRAFKKLIRITKRFGFQYICLGDIIFAGEKEAIKEYNTVVMEYLNKKNKAGWHEKMELKIKEKIK